MNIGEFSTKQLVEELAKREGVERIDVEVYTQSVEIVVSNVKSLQCSHESVTEGPCIVLKVVD